MKFALLALLIFACGATLWADVAVCPALKDSSLDSGASQNYSDGGGPGFFAGTDGDPSPGNIHRALIAFDLSGIPAGSTITNVQMTLTLALVAGAGQGLNEANSATISLYDISRNWGEGTNGSTFTGVQGSGHGLPANPGDATWDAASFEQTFWVNAGGDHSSTASCTYTLMGNTVGTAFTWPSTPQMVADVQGWLNNPSTNFGWELINADETDLRTLYGFYSREWSTFPGGMASQEPALQVTYTPPVTVPVPMWSPWAALAGVMLVSLRAVRGRNGLPIPAFLKPPRD
jgi:hypothetical protein